MKTIFLIRHAKSDWSIPGLADADRPLNQRGYADAHRVGRLLAKEKKESLVLVSSPAIRALSTAMIIAKEINYHPNKIQIHTELYEADAGDYESVISLIDDKFVTAFIFGHNPTISEVVAKLSGTNAVELPTCAVSVIDFSMKEWGEIPGNTGHLKTQVFPKSLTE